MEIKKFVREEKKPVYEDFEFRTEIPKRLLEKLGFKLYKHQAEALKYLYEGKNVIVTTPTASGKSEIFRLFILDNLDYNYILVYPTRALVRDQLEKFKERLELLDFDLPVMEFTGDIHPARRRAFLSEGRGVIFTTPDVLHAFILPNHYQFAEFLSKVKLVVVDELHYYRGILGTSFYYLMKRLRKVLELHKADPQFLALSATLEKPSEFAEKVFERPFVEVTKDYSYQPRKEYWMIDPQGKDIYQLLTTLVKAEIEKGNQVLVFMETKREVEKALISLMNENVFDAAVYKGTLTREDRLRIERAFKEGEIKVLFSTNALELGIDIGSVDTVINVGFPPDGLFSLLQRFGRAGRRKEGKAILILKEDALDQFYKENFELYKKRILNNEVGTIPLNKENPYIAKKHLLAMLNELGQLSEKEITDFEKKVLEELKREGKVSTFYTLTKGKVYKPLVKEKVGFRTMDEEEYLLVLES